MIGIIGLLVSILLPTLSRARSAAVAIKCQNNLRQLITVTRLYADASKDLIPPAHYLDKSKTPVEVTGAPVLLARFTSSMAELAVCPTEPTAIDIVMYSAFYKVSAAMPKYTGYQYNYIFYVDALSSPTTPGFRMSRLGRGSSDQIMLYDGAVSTGYGAPWEIIQARHPGPRFNAGFADGHVEGIAAKKSGTTPGAGGTQNPNGVTLTNYTVDRGRWAIWYAGAEAIPSRKVGASQGLAEPGWGAIVWGLSQWRTG